jgi:hypothetical protein
MNNRLANERLPDLLVWLLDVGPGDLGCPQVIDI